MSGFHKRTVRKVIRNKLDKLFASVDDVTVRDLMKRDTLVTGGCVASMLIGEKVNDYDVYFRTLETTVKVAQYYVAKFNTIKAEKVSAGIDYTPAVRVEERDNLNGDKEQRVLIFMRSAGVAGEQQDDYKYFECYAPEATEDFMASLSDQEDELEQLTELAEEVKTASNKYRPVFLTDNAITLTDKVQLIIRFYGTPEEIHRNYDYLHCTGVYDYAADSLLVTPETQECLLSKTLVYSGSLYPLASVLRMRKFLKRGWRISAGQVLKMLEQTSRIDFSDPVQLKEQLMGVDVAYMHQLIGALQNREAGQRIDSTYLAALIDTIFED